MALLTGLTDQGAEVPVQVTPAGVLVAEGLPGADAVVQMGAGLVVFGGANGLKTAMQWGSVTSASTEGVMAGVTFQLPFVAEPALTVCETSRASIAPGAISVFAWQSYLLPDWTGFRAAVVTVTGGSTAWPAPREGSWMAVGPVA